jgi:hypothetical protein
MAASFDPNWRHGPIDVTLVSTRRPDLLQQTLDSFSRHFFSRVPVRRLFVNLDPLWGDIDADRAVERICRSYFKDVMIRRPAEPSFGGAVKWLWSQPETDRFFHLEDDWLLLRPLNPARLAREMAADRVAQISFSRLNRKAWRKGVWLERFTTSPSMLKTSFARQVSALQDADLDPEKQLYGPGNPALRNLTGQFRHRLHAHRFARAFIADIGRDWREQQGIHKQLVNGRSTWSAASGRS